MNAAQAAIEAALEEGQGLASRIRSTAGAQTRSKKLRSEIKSFCLDWFHRHRPVIAGLLAPEHLRPIDREFQDLLAGAGRLTLRTKLLASVKAVIRLLGQLQAEHAIALAAASAAGNAEPSFVSIAADETMRTILARRWRECAICVEYEAPLASAVMIGGLLEGLLLARILRLADRGPVFRARNAPRDKKGEPVALSHWGLRDFLAVAYELGWISKTTRDIGEIVRDYRNWIHPDKEYTLRAKFSPADAKTIWAIAQSIIAQILAS